LHSTRRGSGNRTTFAAYRTPKTEHFATGTGRKHTHPLTGTKISIPIVNTYSNLSVTPCDKPPTLQPQVEQMAVVTAPLLSFSASGQIAGTQVYSRWKGRPYVRRLVTPADPKTAEQMKTRNSFAFLSDVWKISPAAFRSPWAAYAKNLVMTDRNAWIKLNNGLLRTQADLQGITLSPGAAGGLAVVADITGAAGAITIELDPPAPLPPGWTVIMGVGAAIMDQDPADPTAFEIHAETANLEPYTVTLTGLDPGLYQAAGWFVFQRSASLTDLAYGPGPTTPVTVT
jgi:hypothetical protein